MLVFPNAKINLGLAVTGKRSDGYHTIETVFYPIRWCDALEVLEENSGTINLSFSGLSVAGPPEENLLYKVYNEIKKIRELPPVKIHLHKAIPMGAGLGGGSSDAAFFINLLDQKFSLRLDGSAKQMIASKIGSDCSFFLENKPVAASGKGDILSLLNIDLSGYFILIVYPGIHSNTAEAYAGITPRQTPIGPAKIVETIPVNEWKNHLENDFEKSIFKKYPLIADLKNELYQRGALYASMSGSGSSVFGIFEKEPSVDFPQNFSYFLQPA